MSLTLKTFLSVLRVWLLILSNLMFLTNCRDTPRYSEVQARAQSAPIEKPVKNAEQQPAEVKKPESEAVVVVAPAVADPYTCNTPFRRDELPSAKAALNALLDTYEYETSPGPKALAMSDNGFGYPAVPSQNSGTDPKEVQRIAINRCSALAGGKPCSIVAVDNTFCPDGKGQNLAISKPTSIKDLPFAPQDPNSTWTKSGADGYLAFTLPKAAAISIDGKIVFKASNLSRDNAEALRQSLELCELVAAMVPCVPFAVGNEVVFDGKKWDGKPIIDYKKTTLSKPFLLTPDRGFDEFWGGNYFPNGNPANFRGSIFMGHDGYSFIGTGGEAAVQSGCKQGNGTYPEPCFKVAQNAQAIVSPSFLQASKQIGIHCKVVPRASCEAHQAVGCTSAGAYPILTPDEVKEVNCSASP